jgi:hypothetical protein
VFGVGVYNGGCGAEGDADRPTEQSKEDGLGEELGADVPFGGAEGAAQADLGAAVESGVANIMIISVGSSACSP